MRSFSHQSLLYEGNLALAAAPAQTPKGIEDDPDFFKGSVIYPQVLTRGLLVLADITATRYFNFTPTAERDPVLSAQGSQLRAEVFSACNGVYARLDLLQQGFEGHVAYGTTNVDIGQELRAALSAVKQEDALHLAIGGKGVTLAHFENIDDGLSKFQGALKERPVQMPERWIRALGNASQIHRRMTPAFTLPKARAQAFIASLPHATAKNQAAWLTPTSTGTKLLARRSSNAVYVSGLHRLSALKRIPTNITSLTMYRPEADESGPCMIEVELPGARLTLSLTAESWQGYSGEGALLESLAQQEVLENAEALASSLQFDAVVNEARLMQRWQLESPDLHAALSLLAVSGRLGFDAHEQAYYHRELPHDAQRVLKDNPRLVQARKLVETVQHTDGPEWLVSSNNTTYRVIYDAKLGAERAQCTCTWYLNHQNKRGPCKHILAVQLKENA